VDPLETAKQEIDLPQLLKKMGVRLHPGAGERSYRARCPFHDDKDPSLSLVHWPWGWGWKCHAGCGHGSVVDFLMLRDGLTKAEAIRATLYLAGLDPGPNGRYTRPGFRAGSAPSPQPKAPINPEPPKTAPLEEEHYEYLHLARERLEGLTEPPEILARYGLELETAAELGMGIDEEGWLVIPIYGPDKNLRQIKRRNPDPEAKRGQRYLYKAVGRGAPAWHSPNYSPFGPGVLVVEGEMNAIAAWVALKGHSRLAVVGVAGASSRVGEVTGEMLGRTAYIYADPDTEGAAARARWAEEISQAGGRVYQMPALPEGLEDYADFLRAVGPEKLRAYLLAQIAELEADAEETPVDNPLGIRKLDLSQEAPEARWLVSEMVQAGKVNLIAAYGGVGKSSLAADLIVAVQAGQDWLGRPTFAQVEGALYLDWEDDEHAFVAWMQRSARGRGVEFSDLDVRYVSAAETPPWKGRPLFEVAGMLADHLAQTGKRWLIVVDAFESAMQIDSIKAAEALAAMSALKALAQQGHTVLVLDHLPKLGKGQSRDDLMPIGSVQKTNQARVVVLLEDVTPVDYEQGRSILKARCVKINSARRWDPFAVERTVRQGVASYRLVPLPDPEERRGPLPEKRQAVKKVVIETLEQKGELRKDELLVRVGERVDVGVRTIQVALEELRAAGVISMRGGYRGAPITYFFSQEKDDER
jgi:putative DNA primase/helicase